jgi:hypothetical protein
MKFLPPKNFSCQTLQICNLSIAALDYRGFIKVDEVDGRSLVERAAATSCTMSQICVDAVPGEQ